MHCWRIICKKAQLCIYLFMGALFFFLFFFCTRIITFLLSRYLTNWFAFAQVVQLDLEICRRISNLLFYLYYFVMFVHVGWFNALSCSPQTKKVRAKKLRYDIMSPFSYPYIFHLRDTFYVQCMPALAFLAYIPRNTTEETHMTFPPVPPSLPPASLPAAHHLLRLSGHLRGSRALGANLGR